MQYKFQLFPGMQQITFESSMHTHCRGRLLVIAPLLIPICPILAPMRTEKVPSVPRGLRCHNPWTLRCICPGPGSNVIAPLPIPIRPGPGSIVLPLYLSPICPGPGSNVFEPNVIFCHYSWKMLKQKIAVFTVSNSE
jgi:hypothetical protein